MTHFDLIKQYKLTPSTDTLPADWVRHRNRRTYVQDTEGRCLSLNLCGCELKDAGFLQTADYQHLQVLNLSANKIKTLHLPATLRDLQYLDASENSALHTLTLEGPLPALHTLAADSCALQSFALPEGMQALEKLDLRKNKLAQLTFSAAYPRLSYLDASQNKLTNLRLPGTFPALKYVYLNDNQLVQLVFDTPPVLLDTLHLRNNQLQDLPDNLLGFSGLRTLYLHGNPLPNLPKSASLPEGERDNAAFSVRNYLRSITEDNPIPNDEVKLILLGNSTAGKSTLVHFLRYKEYKSLPSTHGIYIDIWPDSELGFKINIVDFGGQEFYHATHRLFLTESAVTVVAFEEKTNVQGEIEVEIKLYEDGVLKENNMKIDVFPYNYWLESLRYFSQGDQTAMLVQTKMDGSEPIEVVKADRDKYQLPVETPRISVKAAAAGEEEANQDFERFRRKLFAALQKGNEKHSFSEKWLLIKNDLRALPPDQNWMTYEAYQQFCEARRPGISIKEAGNPESMLDQLTHYLHNIGVIFWFGDHPELKKTVFTRPQWVTDTIYKVMNLKVMNKGGKFDHAHVAKVATDVVASDMIDLMCKFELIFPVEKEKDTFIAPQYLPIHNPADSNIALQGLRDDCDQILFTLRFSDFLPRSVLTRFMCKYGPLAENYWKNGIVFKKEKQWFWVDCWNKYDIVVRSNVAQSQFSNELFETFRTITDQNPDLLIAPDATRFVRIKDLFASRPDNVKSIETADKTDWVETSEFDHILGLERGLHGKNITKHPHTMTPTSQDPTPPTQTKPKVFISYAHKEESRYKDIFVNGIKSHAPNWDIFEDKDILLGEDWHQRLQEEVGQSDFAIMLISPWFLQSKYIIDHEVGEFIKKNAAQKFLFFGVLLSNCDFKQWEDLSKRQIFVAHGQDYGINDKRDQQIAFAKLISFDSNNTPIPNENTNEFCMNFVAAANKALEAKRQ